MDSFDFNSYEFYKASEVDVELLKKSLPNCIRIIDSEDDQNNDVLTLEFDRKNCINIKNMLKYIGSGYFSIYHGQIFILIEKIIHLFEKEEHKFQQPRSDRIWLIFEGNDKGKFKYQHHRPLKYSLFYCWPMKRHGLNIDDQNSTQSLQIQQKPFNNQIIKQMQLKKIIIKLLTLCDYLDCTTFAVFTLKSKPHKNFLTLINSNYENFAQEIKQYVNSNQNIDPQKQSDNNVDSKMQKVEKTKEEMTDEDTENLKQIKNKIQNIVKIGQQTYDSLWKKSADILKREHEFQIELISKGMTKVKIKDYRNNNFSSIKELYLLDQVKELFKKTFSELSEKNIILKSDFTYDNFKLEDGELQILAEKQILIHFKQCGLFNSIKQWVNGREGIRNNPQCVEELLEPKISYYYQLVSQLEILKLINYLI